MKSADLLPSLPPRAKILFIRLRSLGDTVLSTPLFAALKSWRPDLRTSVLVEAPHGEVLESNSDIDQVISIDSSRDGVFPGLRARYAALRQVRAAEFDCCINLHGGSTSAWFTALSGASYRVGLKTFRNRFAYNLSIEVPSNTSSGEKRHTVEYQMDWLRCLGLPPAPVPPLRLVPDPSLELIVRDKLVNAGLDPTRDYVLIQPTSKFHTKEWTAAGFAEIADDLKKRYELQVVLVAGPAETGKIQQVIAQCRTSPIVAQNVSVSELAWIIRGARLFIGNDSGPTHMAAALRVPVVVLFGSSDSQVWYPWQSSFEIVQNPFECNPCPGYRCLVYDKPKCILSITSEQVKAAVDSQLRVSRRMPLSS